MFFRAFTSVEESSLPSALTYTIEYQASQVLANGDRSFLRQVVESQQLPDSLYAEVEFFGSVPRNLRNEVRTYFHTHARTLYETARQLLEQREDEVLREQVQRPLVSEDEIRRMIETV